MPKRLMCVTIGQSPRRDIVPEMLAATRTPLAAEECGVLDALDETEIADLRARTGASCLVSRLRDGREAVLDGAAVESRLRRLLGEIDRQGFDLIVLLCSGHFGSSRLATPFIEPQHVVDHFTAALASGRDSIGVLLPNRQQISEFPPIPGLTPEFAAVSPYQGENEARLHDAGLRLQGTGLIVMHCMGYTGAMQKKVKEASGRPVLLPRKMVAHAIDMLLA